MTRMSLRGVVRFALPIVLLAVAACGDAETTDTRGYTKAPTEKPGPRIRPEPTTEMSELGEPNRPRVVELPVADTAAARQQPQS